MTPDEQEALSIKYNVARIVRLSSGNYALFAPWHNDEGMPIIHIGTLADMEGLIPTFAEVTDWLSVDNHRAEYDEVKATGLLARLGLTKPKQPFERRI